MDITLVYNSNGGDSTPNPITETVPEGETGVSITLSGAITKQAPTGKYTFKKWKIGDTEYDPNATVTLTENSVAEAVWMLNSTTVSPKAYGYSPNGTKNALGTTRYHHQPSYPHPMGT